VPGQQKHGQAAPFCGCFCSGYKMVAWRGQDSWPSPREEEGRQLLPSPFSLRPTRKKAEPGRRVVQAPAGQGAGVQEKAGLGS
jgi:hypothetical protein